MYQSKKRFTMKQIILEATEDSPLITFEDISNEISISGKSFPEDVDEVYSPFSNWFKLHAKSLNGNVHIEIKLEYYNTASSKKILQILLAFTELQNNGIPIKVTWHYHEDDEDMVEAGKRYKDLTELEFDFVEI